MLKKSTSNLSAQKLRIILICTILLLLIAAGGVFFFARTVLAGYAGDVQKITNATASSSKNLANLKALEGKLADNQEAVERARSLVAESKSYEYQDQIIKDINTFANKSGVKIAGYQFNSEGANATTGTAAAPAAGSAAATPTPAPAGGLKTVNVSVNLKSPMRYEDTMEFVHMIEKNLTKMQLGGITMTKEATSSSITVSALTIEVYVK